MRKKGAAVMNAKIRGSGEWVGGRKCFEVHIRKKILDLEKLLVEMWILKVLIVRSQMEMKNIISHRMKGELFYKVTKN